MEWEVRRFMRGGSGSWRRAGRIGFALVETSGFRPQRGEPVELILSTGDRLHIHAGVDAATLRLVLSALREAR